MLRLAAPESSELLQLVFRRYPDLEWATFALFGWRETSDGLILTLTSIFPPMPGDLDEAVGHVALLEPYSLRAALMVEKQRLAIGVIHSHPRRCPPLPSRVDDDMDGYYSDYFEGFAPGRPYISLIASEMGDGAPTISGRVHFRGEWHSVTKVASEGTRVGLWSRARAHATARREPRQRTARLTAAFGDEADELLRESTVAVVGAGGTGSAAIEVLARAGVGHIVIADPDFLSTSNLERVHGSEPAHAADRVTKVEVARDHVRSIDPECRVTGLVGSLPQREVVDAVLHADVAIGCTDQQHSRLALSELAYRYLLPAIDCGVLLEGDHGQITGQCVQLVRFRSSDPCAICSRMISFEKVSRELMPEGERRQRRAAAREAEQRGEKGDAYWHDDPQLNTVGYLTTAAGSLAAGYAIGWLTRRFDPPFSRLQMNIGAKFFDVTDDREKARPDCSCRVVRGWADAGAHRATISAPAHWPPVRLVRSQDHAPRRHE